MSLTLIKLSGSQKQKEEKKDENKREVGCGKRQADRTLWGQPDLQRACQDSQGYKNKKGGDSLEEKETVQKKKEREVIRQGDVD